MLRQPIVCVLGHVDHGKCVAPDTVIQLGDGRLLQAKELYEAYAEKGAKMQIDDGTVVELEEGPEVFSFDGKKIVRKRVSHVWKRNSPKNMTRVGLASGDTLTVTPEHPFYAASAEAPHGWKQAGTLKEGDFVLVAGKLELQEAPISRLKEEIAKKLMVAESFVVFVDKEKGAEFFRKISDANLDSMRKRELFSTNPYCCVKESRFRAVDFFRLCSYLGFTAECAYDMIGHIKNSSRKWRAGHTSNKMRLPRDEADFSAMAYVLGCVQGDGCLYSKRVMLHNNDSEIHEEYMKGLKQVFGLDAKVVQNHTCKTVVSTGGMTLGRFFIEIFGLPFKNKSESIIVPDMLLLRNDTTASFIRGWFDTDGYVSEINNCIEITSKSKRMVKMAAACLLRFGILGVIYEKNGYWTLRIANAPYVKKFLENIGSNLKFKRNRMIAVIPKTSTSRVFDMLPLDGAHLKGNVSVNDCQVPYASRYFEYSCLSRGTVMKMLVYGASEKTKTEMRAFTEESIRFVRVRTVKAVEPESEFVYDFSVPQTKNFIAERTVLHNTSLLDAIRKTSLAKKEAGLITQHIGASEVPRDAIGEVCGDALTRMKIKLEIPGILFIDTPGHAAFSNLRERGGSIADIAVLVIDINQGFQPQTIESIGILKGFKTPFIIAANKVDVIDGWKGGSGNCIAQSIKRQNERVQARLDELLYTLVGRMGELGMNAERFDRVTDFTKQIALVPVSAKTGEGVLELLLFLAGLSQKFLESGLDAKEDSPARGSILEVREERGLGTIIDAIIYEGMLKQNDTIVFGTINGAEKTKVRSIIKPKPASKIVNPQEKYDYPKEAVAACGVRIFAPGLEDALSGSPFAIANTPEEQTAQSEVIEGQIKKVVFEKSEHGVVAKAESLGSLEAMLNLLEVEKIPVRKSGIGEISKKDALEARRSGGEDAALSAVFGFGVKASKEAEEEEAAGGVKILANEVIYSLIEDYKKWVCSCREREKCELLSSHVYPVKLKILPGCCFRKSNPAIFGVDVLAGKLLVKCPLMNSRGKEIGEVKGIQNKNEAAQSAEKGEQVAISIEGAAFGKDIGEGDVLYAHLTEREWGEISKKCRCALGKEEEKLLGEILGITSTSHF